MRLSFINSIRALFPVWNFFDRVSLPYELWIKIGGEWVRKDFSHKTQIYHLLLNPKGTRQLLEQSLLELFAQDVELCEEREIPKLVSFNLISNIADGYSWKVLRRRAVIYEGQL